MKKLYSLIIALMLLLCVPAFASDIEIIPTIFSRSTLQDRVWVGTFQIVWNEFVDKYIHMPVRFREGTPTIVKELNIKSFTTNDLSPKCYYKFSGNIKKNTAKEIAKALKKKFNETSDILNSLDLTPASNNFLIYAMLKKNFEFLKEFDKLGQSNFGQNMTAEYFGINNNTAQEVKDNVTVLFYNNPKDYAVKLATKSEDEVYLYKNGANKDFASIYRDMNKKIGNFDGETSLGKKDELKVPDIKFDASRTFEALENKRVMGTNIVIGQAIETVKFNMDNKGVQLKSEAAMTFCTTALMPEEVKPRYFYFDDTFVIFLKEKEKTNPYFALRVNDITKFQ